MSPEEAAGNAMLLLVAGHDSTVNTITHCVLTAAAQPRIPGVCCAARPDLIPRTIEEVLRLQSAVQFFPSRSATADIEIGGTVIPHGSPRCTLIYGAANRDPRPGFDNPDRFDPQRADNEHVGLGPRHPHLASAVRWRAWRSTWRWRPSCAAWTTRGWPSTRRPTASQS